jgi:hypothetical protein
LEHVLNIYACEYMKKLNGMARSNGILIKSNNGGIKVEVTFMFVGSVVKKWM